MMRVLVVDDDPGTVVYLETLLRGEGYLVQTAADGAEALAKAKELAPDVILTDLAMPGLTGNQLTAAVRATDFLKRVYVIFLTIHGEKADKMKAFLSGANDFLVKPARAGEILGRLEVAHRMIQLEHQIRGFPGTEPAPGGPPGRDPASAPVPAPVPRSVPAASAAHGAPPRPLPEPRPVQDPAAVLPDGAEIQEVLGRIRDLLTAAGQSLGQSDLRSARSFCREAQADLEQVIEGLAGGGAEGDAGGGAGSAPP